MSDVGQVKATKEQLRALEAAAEREGVELDPTRPLRGYAAALRKTVTFLYPDAKRKQDHDAIIGELLGVSDRAARDCLNEAQNMRADHVAVIVCKLGDLLSKYAASKGPYYEGEKGFSTAGFEFRPEYLSEAVISPVFAGYGFNHGDRARTTAGRQFVFEFLLYGADLSDTRKLKALALCAMVDELSGYELDTLLRVAAMLENESVRDTAEELSVGIEEGFGEVYHHRYAQYEGGEPTEEEASPAFRAKQMQRYALELLGNVRQMVGNLEEWAQTLDPMTQWEYEEAQADKRRKTARR